MTNASLTRRHFLAAAAATGAAAAATLDAVENPDAMTDYLHAIVAARRGNKFAAQSYLDEAVKKDASLKSYADNDLELALLKK